MSADDPNKCFVCQHRITRPEIGGPADAFCSQVCEDSSDAEVRRLIEQDGRLSL